MRTLSSKEIGVLRSLNRRVLIEKHNGLANKRRS